MIILCYHELADDESTPWILKPDSFAEHLEILADRGYCTGKLPTSADIIDAKRLVITFDDGTVGCLRHAHSLLLRHGMTAYFYICPGYTTGAVQPYRSATYMTWSEIRELSRQHVIGAHSLTHRTFDNLPEVDRRQEMAESKAVIEDQIGQSCLDWATPYGYVDAELQRLAQAVGFSTLVTTQFGANHSIHPFCLQRWEVHSPCPRKEFISLLDQLEAVR